LTPEPKKPVQELQRQGTCVDSVQIRPPRLLRPRRRLARQLRRSAHGLTGLRTAPRQRPAAAPKSSLAGPMNGLWHRTGGIVKVGRQPRIPRHPTPIADG
jgi:hypothetical protein